MRNDEMAYDIADYLLIRNDEVIAVSGNTDFEDVEEVAVKVKAGDSIAQVIQARITYGN
tara:strand:+ start:13 stop:189 length:177 start_codon:yes stop_codon:yes gene_type:complete